MESNNTKKRGRPAKKKLVPDPMLEALRDSGKATGEDEPHDIQPAYEDVANARKKKYPIAYKWPDFKFFHCMVVRGEGFAVEYDGLSNNQAAPNARFDRGMGSPVTVLLGKSCVLPNEIVEAIKDTTVDHPIVLGGTIDEKSNGFNGFEKRSRFKVMVAGPATPEEYEANVLVGKNRRV